MTTTTTFVRGDYAVRGSWREGTNDVYSLMSCFESDEYGLTSMGLQAGDVAIDLGAHIGGVSLLLGAMGLRVYAYEGLPENYELLCENIALNDMADRITPVLAAVCGKNGRVAMHAGEADDPMHQHIGGLYAASPIAEWVDGLTLNSVFSRNGIKRCAVLKMDAEGAEWAIIETASKVTLRRIACMTGEYHTIAGPSPRTRARLLALTQGLFEDATGTEDEGGLGPFTFVQKAWKGHLRPEGGVMT